MKNSRKYLFGICYGESMKPLINPGDQLVIKPVAISSVMVGEIVVFKKKSKYISHRVLWRYKNKLHVKGDNSREFDSPIGPHQLLGKLISTKSSRGVIKFNSKKSLKMRYYYWLCSWIVFLLPVTGYKVALLLVRGRGLLARLQTERKKN